MSRPDLAEIVSAVLAELGQAASGGLARGPGGRPEVPMRRAAAATPTPGDAGTGAPRPREGAGATPPVTVAEATACSPRGRTERDAPVSENDVLASQRVGMSRSRPRRSSAATRAAPATSSDPAAPAARTGGPEMVQRIVADLQRRLDDPARG